MAAARGQRSQWHRVRSGVGRRGTNTVAMRVADQQRSKFLKLGEVMNEAENDMLAFMTDEVRDLGRPRQQLQRCRTPCQS